MTTFTVRPSRVRRAVLAATVVAAALLAPVSDATWSIVIADRRTGEVAVGTVTCLTSIDLRAIVPVVVVGKGAAACQASGDFDGIRRPVIFNGIRNGLSPATILQSLSQISGHQSRQYGIADTQGRMLTFTGSSCLQWAGGVTGEDGTMVYAIQGNILAGSCVVPAIEAAILATDGDMAAKLMAGMEAARLAGGDGRCSCSPSNPTSCGCPPSSFNKSGHIGTMIVARIGDTDDTICNASGCADGNYFLNFNLPFQASNRPDPVFQLQALYDDWRDAHVGRPDAMQSSFSFDPPYLLADPEATTILTIELRDWTGEPITHPIDELTVAHAPGSDNISSIGDVIDMGGGVFALEITGAAMNGLDRFRITADDGIRDVVLAPDATLAVSNLTDIVINTGTLTDGSVVDITRPDDLWFHTRSGFGQSLTDLHKFEATIEARNTLANPVMIDLSIESRIDEPTGSARASLFDWNANAFDTVGNFAVTSADSLATIPDIPAADYIDAEGLIRLRLRHVVVAPIFAFTFDSFIDWVEIDVR